MTLGSAGRFFMELGRKWAADHVSGVRAMLARVQRLEHSRSCTSPFESAYGSLLAWEADCQSAMDAGRMDSRDVPLVVTAVRRWHGEGVWR